MNYEIITKEQFKELYSDNLSHKRHNKLIDIIEGRVNEILYDLHLKKHIDLDWYCYENGDTERENCPGNFDPDTCKEQICLIGNITFEEYLLDIGKTLYGSIPTRWLWEEGYLEECANAKISFNKKKEALKILQKNKREELKIKKQITIDSTKSKLTKDELRFVKFK